METLLNQSESTGKDFEFLIVGNIIIPDEKFEQIMTPNALVWKKISRGNWDFYEVGTDEFSYSMEDTGIQMTFNDSIPFDKAIMIVNDVIANIKSLGQEADFFILDKTKIYKFHR